MVRSKSVLVIGPGARFISGISYYTAALSKALSQHTDVSILLIRKLCPKIIYPGRDRIGKYSSKDIGIPEVPFQESLDWYWGLGIFKSIKFIKRQKPDYIILQWWTGTVLHTYLLIALIAKLLRIKIILEFHESIEVSEKKILPVKWYIQAGMWMLSRASTSGVVHSKHDQHRIGEDLPIKNLPLTVIHHGPYELAQVEVTKKPSDLIRLTYFGVIRPYKGTDELVDAFAQLLETNQKIHLTIAGEVWQNYSDALERAKRLPSEHVRVIPKYLDDEDVATLFANTDIIVLPYRRSSASGPLHLAMAAGLPIVTTNIPALVEVTQEYGGVRYAEPENSDSLAQSIEEALPLVGTQYEDPHSWENVSRRFLEIMN